jgi:hypothetical protein
MTECVDGAVCCHEEREHVESLRSFVIDKLGGGPNRAQTQNSLPVFWRKPCRIQAFRGFPDAQPDS